MARASVALSRALRASFDDMRGQDGCVDLAISVTRHPLGHGKMVDRLGVSYGPQPAAAIFSLGT